MRSTPRDWFAATPLSGANAAFVYELQEQFLSGPEALAAEWRSYCQALAAGHSRTAADVAHGPLCAALRARPQGARATAETVPPGAAHELAARHGQLWSSDRLL